MSDGDIDFTRHSVAREPMQVLADGTRRFSVNFHPPRAVGAGEAPPNDRRLSGSGWVDLTESHVVFTEMRDGAVHLTRRFELSDIANVECSEAEGIVVIRTAMEDRYVTVWLRQPDEAATLKSLLPDRRTPGFTAQQGAEADFSGRLQIVSPKVRVVPALIALNVLVFAIMAMAGAGVFEAQPEVHVRFGSNYGPLTWTGEPWRLLTSAFLHFGILHVAFNMYALYSGGLLTERLYGSARFLVIYLLASFAGSVVSGWWDASRNSAGASGAVFGVYGALLVFMALRRQEIPVRLLKSAGRGALILCGYSLLVGATSPLIDNACHVGGLLGGAAAGLLLARPLQIEERSARQPGRIALVALGVCAVLMLISLPLWSPNGGRRQEVLVLKEIRTFGEKELPLVNRYLEIANSLEKVGSPIAAAQIQAEIIPQWREAIGPILGIDPTRISDHSLAYRVRTLQDYMRHRDQAMTLTVAALNGDQRALADAPAAWLRVQENIDQLVKRE